MSKNEHPYAVLRKKQKINNNPFGDLPPVDSFNEDKVENEDEQNIDNNEENHNQNSNEETEVQNDKNLNNNRTPQEARNEVAEQNKENTQENKNEVVKENEKEIPHENNNETPETKDRDNDNQNDKNKPPEKQSPIDEQIVKVNRISNEDLEIKIRNMEKPRQITYTARSNSRHPLNVLTIACLNLSNFSAPMAWYQNLLNDIAQDVLEKCPELFDKLAHIKETVESYSPREIDALKEMMNSYIRSITKEHIK